MKKYDLLWSKGTTKRYYVNGTGKEIQIGKYRGPDKFDRDFNKKYIWHNKWYVDLFGGKTKLFTTQLQAKKYLKLLINKVYSSKQLKTRGKK